MANDPHKLTRQERLAAKLRENLRRRKAQARALQENTAEVPGDSAPAALSKDGGES
ncbi:hypothetical protein [Allopontixanthobacter sp.]|uniref:hypothetical protein n=1 Tax=Allopontixanthobacter sp. TaxID=2906452 RepID=UPI002AB805C2|nr:hypothetical protein [Allopontixanthobacter sp.]MDZ4307093.1 hypothetical protein [Allopontixanthobacter sp.]